MTKNSKTIIYLFLPFFIMGTAAVILLVLHSKKAGAFQEKYRQLRIGSSMQEILKGWGKPEYRISVEGGKTLLSYTNETHPIHMMEKINFTKKEAPKTDRIVSMDELSELSTYSNAELLFDADDRLEAYTKIGEEVFCSFGARRDSGLRLERLYRFSVRTRAEP